MPVESPILYITGPSPLFVASNRNSRGFTLIEIAIVLVIIGLLLGGVLRGASIMDDARNKDLIKSVQDLQAAALSFKQTYGYWPGDMPAATVTATFSSITGCGGNSNGAIGAGAETNCARDELIAAGLIKGTIGQPLTASNGSTLSVTSIAGAGGFAPVLPTNWVNVVLISGGTLNCDSVVQLDRAVDDGNPTSGNLIANPGASCVVAGVPAQNATTAVTKAALRIN